MTEHVNAAPPAERDTAAEKRARTTWNRPLPHWLLEGIFIVVSVMLGFALAQYGERRAERALAGRALAGLSAEIDHNLAILEPMVPVHAEWVEALAGAHASTGGQAAIDVWFATRPALPPAAKSPFPFLRRSAWDAALSGGVLRLIDYDLAAALSEVYALQAITTGNVDRLAEGALSDPVTFDPAGRAAAVRMLWLTLADIQSAEALLLGLYRQHLPALRAAGEAYR